MIIRKFIGPDMFDWILHCVADVCTLPSALLVSCDFCCEVSLESHSMFGQYAVVFIFKPDFKLTSFNWFLNVLFMKLIVENTCSHR